MVLLFFDDRRIFTQTENKAIIKEQKREAKI